MLYIIVNCYYEEEVVVYTITHSLLKILWVSGDRDEGSKRARTGVSDCSARQSLTCRYSFLGKKKKTQNKYLQQFTWLSKSVIRNEKCVVTVL